MINIKSEPLCKATAHTSLRSGRTFFSRTRKRRTARRGTSIQAVHTFLTLDARRRADARRSKCRQIRAETGR
ncbi:hypothetical protein D1O30_11035 [Methylocystis hirsuta]|uniref:Uncharacterized protein n=1 Tax=Methylocystis hirsuta TaxID=369798 RepID=A0A3M9XPA0_9HYPH|nr:hypothetical protein D1O30_11035 [Methylocystis hirsuta]